MPRGSSELTPQLLQARCAPMFFEVSASVCSVYYHLDVWLCFHCALVILTSNTGNPKAMWGTSHFTAKTEAKVLVKWWILWPIDLCRNPSYNSSMQIRVYQLQYILTFFVLRFHPKISEVHATWLQFFRNSITLSRAQTLVPHLWFCHFATKPITGRRESNNCCRLTMYTV